MQNRKSAKRPKRTSRKSLIRKASAVKKEIEQLRAWAVSKRALDLILNAEGCGITYVGRVIELKISAAFEGDFLFVMDTLVQSRSSIPPIQISLIPQLWQKSEVSDYIGRAIHVDNGRNGRRSFTIKESALPVKPNLDKVLDQTRHWSKARTNLHVFLYQGSHALSFIGQAHQPSADFFGISPSGFSAQLTLFLKDYAHAEIEIEEKNTKITLINAQATEACVISDAPTPPEDFFKYFPSATSAVQ
jgi:hypothetical protein